MELDRRHLWAAAAAFAMSASRAEAHASEGGFVLLLPTGLYTAGGVATVALTVLILMLAPPSTEARLFRPLRLWSPLPIGVATVTSCLSALVLCALVWIGRAGPTDPTKNLLPLTVWTLWWIGLVSVQGLFGDLWRFLNPLTGPARLIRQAAGRGPVLRYPAKLGAWPGVAMFLSFVAFLLSDPTPTDPGRLSLVVGLYFGANLVLTLLFGGRWLLSAEVATMLMRTYGRAGIFGRRGKVAAGLWGWQVFARPAPRLAGAVFVLLLLGSGSFDGLNETFRWLSFIGVNPLEFPGRSAVVRETLTGLLVFNAGLVAAFAAAVWLGERLARGRAAYGLAFRTLAPSILPIALGYHVGHYLTAILVDGQYALAAASDPLARGDDLLGLGTFYVTTGFFATEATVRVIWLSQAGAVVVGHVLAIFLAHGLSRRLHPEPGRAALSQVPLAAFMVAYTFFGLWLLASPRG